MPGFERFDLETDADVRIHGVCAGEGPPVLLLHGHPQTHLTWHEVAPRLVRAGYRVIASDLRGYGDSSRLPGDAEHVNYSKRSMARDQITVMRALGHERFAVVGHDRGGRVAHRMALDYPDAIDRVAALDIVPTWTMYAGANRELATRYFWWLLLIQPEPFPERLIEADPEYYLRRHLDGQSTTAGVPSESLIREYLRCYCVPGTIHAICEDYRAAATIDLEHDAADADRRVEAPLLVLWGAKGAVGALFDVLETWRDKGVDMQGKPIDCGHVLQEEAPEATTDALLKFLQYSR